jgi:hypothetical protein
MEFVPIIALAVAALSAVAVGARRTILGERMERSLEPLKSGSLPAVHGGARRIRVVRRTISTHVDTVGQDRGTIVPVEAPAQIPRAS